MKIKTILLCSAVLLPPLGWSQTPVEQLVDICNGAYGGVFPSPNSEPLGACQWD